MDCDCLQNPVMLHDVAVSWPRPGSWKFAELQRGKSVPKSCNDCRGIPAHNRGSLVSLQKLHPTFPSASAPQEQQELREVFTKLDANGHSEHNALTHSLTMR